MKLWVVLTFVIVLLAANAVRLALRLDKSASSQLVKLNGARGAETSGKAPNRDNRQEFYSAKLPELAENLHRAGLPPKMVGALISAEIDHQFRSREEAMRPSKPTPYWEAELVPEPLQIRLARLDLRREKARLRQKLLGPDPDQPDDNTPVALEKREQLRMITEDYAALIADTRGRTGAGALESEKKEIEFLEAERQRELSSLLTPEELANYDLILSGAVSDLRRDLRYFDATDAELLAIGTAVKEKRQAAAAQGAKVSSDRRILEEEAQARRDATIRSTIGEARFGEYLKARDADYRLVRDMSGRAGMPPQVADQVFELRAAVFTQASQIGDNAGLDVAARKEALKQLVDGTRGQVRAILGPDVSVAVIKQLDSTWLRYLEQGTLPVLRESGISTSRSLLQSAPPR